MLSVITELGVFGLDYDKLDEIIVIRNNEMNAMYYEYLELEALLRGENVTCPIIDNLVNEWDEEREFHVEKEKKGTSITIECQDGSFMAVKETLSRHFMLFRDFFNDYPNENKIALPNLLMRNVQSVIANVFHSHLNLNPLTDSMLYTLRTLNPSYNTCFLLFDLRELSKEVVMELVAQVTEDEKENIIAAHRISNAEGDHYTISSSPLPLPRGIELLAATIEGRRYLASIEGCKLINHNGWAFVNAVKRNEILLATSLLEKGFKDDKFVGLSYLERITVCDAISIYITKLRDEKDRYSFISACTMLGIRHRSLENNYMKVTTPYNLRLDDMNLGLIDGNRDYEIKRALKHYGFESACTLLRLRN